MLTDDKVTEIFVMADEFCKVFNQMQKRRGLNPSNTGKRHNFRSNRMSDAEIMTILIIFHMSNHKCFKHFYLNEICINKRHLLPNVVSYNRFTEFRVWFSLVGRKETGCNVPQVAACFYYYQLSRIILRWQPEQL